MNKNEIILLNGITLENFERSGYEGQGDEALRTRFIMGAVNNLFDFANTIADQQSQIAKLENRIFELDRNANIVKGRLTEMVLEEAERCGEADDFLKNLAEEFDLKVSTTKVVEVTVSARVTLTLDWGQDVENVSLDCDELAISSDQQDVEVEYVTDIEIENISAK